MEKVIERLGKVKASKILDVATGAGVFIDVLMEYLGEYKEFTGIDTLQPYIDYAKKRLDGKPVEILNMNLYEMSFANESYDMVTMANSLHHLADQSKALGEMIRVLKPGGCLIIDEMYQGGGQRPEQLSHQHLHHWSAKIDKLRGEYHDETYTAQKLEDIVWGAGLENIEIFLYEYPVEDIKNMEKIEKTLEVIPKHADRIKDKPEYEAILKEGEEIAEYIRENGLGSSSRVFIIGRKPQ